MHRDKFTAKLVRIVESIETGKLALDVRALYVFGSYARGALEPGDLDLIAVHGPGKQEIEKLLEEELRRKQPYRFVRGGDAASKLQSARLRLFRKPGERVQVLFTTSLDQLTGSNSRIKPSDPVLIWSTDDRQWREKIEAIRPNPQAGRAERNHLCDLKRLSDSVFTMERTVDLVEQGKLKFTRQAIDSLEITLNESHRRSLERWRSVPVMGKKSLETLPYAMGWIEQHGGHCLPPQQTEIWDEKFTLRCEVGKPSLQRMLFYFETKPKLARQCLIPHFQKTAENELLIFECGLPWKEFADESIH